MATVHELKCGCMLHEIVGLIRKCEGTTSRSLSGRMVSKPDNAERKHNDAMERHDAIRTYEVAGIVP